MLKDTNSLDGAHIQMKIIYSLTFLFTYYWLQYIFIKIVHVFWKLYSAQHYNAKLWCH